MTCCLEQALLDTIGAMDCIPISRENLFEGYRRCKECVPYMVLKVRGGAGLRTSSGLQKVQQVDISAYFSDSAEAKAKVFREILEDWVYASGCLDLGVCGCFCQQGAPISVINPPANGVIRYSLSFRGFFKASESGSDSLSASLSASV